MNEHTKGFISGFFICLAIRITLLLFFHRRFFLFHRHFTVHFTLPLVQDQLIVVVVEPSFVAFVELLVERVSSHTRYLPGARDTGVCARGDQHRQLLLLRAAQNIDVQRGPCSLRLRRHAFCVGDL